LGLLGTAYYIHVLISPSVFSGAIEDARQIVRDSLAKGNIGERALAVAGSRTCVGSCAPAGLPNHKDNPLSGLGLSTLNGLETEGKVDRLQS